MSWNLQDLSSSDQPSPVNSAVSTYSPVYVYIPTLALGRIYPHASASPVAFHLKRAINIPFLSVMVEFELLVPSAGRGVSLAWKVGATILTAALADAGREKNAIQAGVVVVVDDEQDV